MFRWRIATETLLIVAGIVALRLLAHFLSIDFIALSPLYSSVVGGGIFVIGLLVAGTLVDYKEAEKMPAEIAAGLENIYGDCLSIHKREKKFDLVALRRSLVAVVASLRHDLATSGSRTCLGAVNDLSKSFDQLEEIAVPLPYVIRLRTEQSNMRKGLLRIYHIQRVAFLPSARLLIQSVVGMIIGSLLLTELDSLFQSIVVLTFISYFFIYLVKLLTVLDTPFNVHEETHDDVSLFLLYEFEQRIAGEEAAASIPAP